MGGVIRGVVEALMDRKVVVITAADMRYPRLGLGCRARGFSESGGAGSKTMELQG